MWLNTDNSIVPREKERKMQSFKGLPDTSKKWKIYWAIAVQVGTVCPKGFLPVYSVDTEEDAKMLVTLACPLGLDNLHYAPELVGTSGDERIRKFVAFGKRLVKIHQMMKKRMKKTEQHCTKENHEIRKS